jgi:hypothetical protein
MVLNRKFSSSSAIFDFLIRRATIATTLWSIEHILGSGLSLRIEARAVPFTRASILLVVRITRGCNIRLLGFYGHANAPGEVRVSGGTAEGVPFQSPVYATGSNLLTDPDSQTAVPNFALETLGFHQTIC